MDVDTKLELSCEEFHRVLESGTLPFHPKSGILETESAPYPGLDTLAHFASIVYKLEEVGPKLNDWKLLTTARNIDENNGYFGAAFYSFSLQQVVLAHRGTVVSNLGAMWTNLTAVVFKNYSHFVSSATTFADIVKCVIRKANNQHGKHLHLSITGHSLGGWLAQVTGFSVKYLTVEDGKFVKADGLHAHVVAFESPGCKAMLEKIVNFYYYRYGRRASLEALDISSYLSTPNHINTCGPHIGSIYRVLVDVSTFTNVDRHTTLCSGHKMNNFIKALAYKSKIYKIKNWPCNMHKYNMYESQANKYHLMIDDERSMGSLRMFSDDELKLLNFWIIFKRENVKVNKIQSFLTEHNLGRIDDLFGDFSIDFKNHTITCESEKVLDTVVRRTKLLVRWFPAVLTVVVDQLNREIPTILYSTANQNYLDSLPECVLDFTDGIGLREFLQSDHRRILQIETEDCDLEMLRLFSITRQLREPLSHLDRYVKYGCQTFLRWSDMVNLENVVDIENLPENFTQDNLLVIDCASSDISQNLGRGQIFKRLLDNINKKVIFVSDYQKSDLDSLSSVAMSAVHVKSFESNQLTEDSQKRLFKRKMLVIEDQILSIADFIGETNFNYFSLNIISLIDMEDFKNILRNNNYVIKRENTCPNLLNCGLNISTIDREVSVETLVKIASAGDLLMISDDCREVLRAKEEANLDAEYTVIWVSEEEKFEQTILKNPNKRVYWVEANYSFSAATVKKMYHKGFYMRRRFHHQVMFALEEFAVQSKVEDIFIFKGVPSKESLVSWIQLTERDSGIFLKKETIFTAASDDEESNILKENFKKPVHVLQFQENGGQFLWKRSLGSLEGLRPYMRSSRVIAEEDLDKLKQKAVIIAAEPGTGKSTSLANISRRLHSDPANWVIWIDLKHFKIPKNIPTEPRQRFEFLLREHLVQDSWLNGLFQFCLHHEHSRQINLMFDGFDEVKIDHFSENVAKSEVLRLLQYLNEETTARVWVTTRSHETELLENALSTFAVTFEKIKDQLQLDYLENFWRAHLLLEPEGSGVAKIEDYVRDLYTRAVTDLGRDIQNFMGVPLQLRMLAEVFLGDVNKCVESQTETEKVLQVENVFSLYEKFINTKYSLYLNAKTGLSTGMKRDLYDMNVHNFTETHRMLGLRTLFPQFAEEYHEDFESRLGGAELCRIGLVQSGGDTSENIEFIHRTLSEYFCAEQTVHWLSKKGNYHSQVPLIELLLTDILLLDCNKIIRIFINNLFSLKPISDTAQKFITSQIGKLWDEKPHLFFNKNQQTALHLAIEENNVGIIDFLVSGLKSGSAQKGLVGFVAAHDRHGDTVLGLASRKAEVEFTGISNVYVKIMKIIVQSIETCPYEMKLGLLLATCLKRQCSRLLSEYLENSVCLKTAFTRIQNIITNVIPPFLAAVEDCRGKDVQMLYDQLENDIERHYALLSWNRNGDTALHIAAKARKDDQNIIKILLSHNIPGIDRSYNAAGQTPLHYAAEEGNCEIVEILINMGVDNNSVNNIGSTALHLAAQRGHLSVVEYLVKKGGDINSADNIGSTALHLAVQRGHLSVVEYLVKKGGDINSADNIGSTALHLAVQKGHLSVVEYLVEKGVDINFVGTDGYTTLHRAAEEGHLAMVTHLVKKGVDVNSADKNGNTALHLAALNEHFQVVEYLLGIDIYSGENIDSTAIHRAEQESYVPVMESLEKKGVDINSVLHRAAKRGHLAVVMYLVKKGVDINSADRDGCTALHKAAEEGHLEVVKYLVEKGVCINSANKDGCNALHRAAEEGHLEVVEYLVEVKADIYSRDKKGRIAKLRAAFSGHQLIVKYLTESEVNIVDGNTALHFAAYKGHFRVVEYLVKKGVDINSAYNDGRTALHRAAFNGHFQVVEYLIEKGVNINSTDKDGRTALFFAVFHGDLPAVKIFVRNGAGINIVDKKGINALCRAVCRGHLPVVEYLVDEGAYINYADRSGWTALTHAAHSANFPIVKLLVQKGAKVKSVNDDGRNVLFIAANKGPINIEMIKFLVETETSREKCRTSSEIDIKKRAYINCEDDEGRTVLFYSAQKGFLPVVEFLLENGANINYVDEEGVTALSFAVLAGQSEVVKILVQKGANINIACDDGKTALFHAVHKEYYEIVELLVSNGAAVNHTDRIGWTAMSYAAHQGCLPIVKILVEKTVDTVDTMGLTALSLAARAGHLSLVEFLFNETMNTEYVKYRALTAMMYAAREGHLEVVEFLMKKNIDINCSDEKGVTALSYAAYGGSVSVVFFLLENGANVHSVDQAGLTALSYAAREGCMYAVEILVNSDNMNSKDKDGMTALSLAARNGHLSVVALLVEMGADINTSDESGWTALSHAAFGDSVEVMQFLLKKGVVVDSTDKNGITTLSLAARSGRLSVVELLVANRADINSADNKGMTALSHAACSGRLSVVKLLLANGADINSADNEGVTALSHAACSGRLSVVELLLKEIGADIDLADSEGVSALAYAAREGYIPVVKFLLDEGADVAARDKKGRTALFLAAYYGHLPVVKLLLEKEADINSKDDEGRTALAGAVLMLHGPITQKDVDINLKRRNAWSLATFKKCLPVVELLKNQGADINSADVKGRNALFGAAFIGCFPLVKALLEMGADIESADNEGHTVMYYASQAQEGRLPLEKFLSEKLSMCGESRGQCNVVQFPNK